MEPLFAAVTHGCRAERYPEALYDVLVGRIDQRDEFLARKKLGLSGSHLAALSGFFDPPWAAPVADLPKIAQAFLLNDAGFCLRALGRLADAVAPMAAGLEARIALEDLSNAAISASNLSELHLTLGLVSAAVADGERAVDFGDRSGNFSQRMISRTAHADALA